MVLANAGVWVAGHRASYKAPAQLCVQKEGGDAERFSSEDSLLGLEAREELVWSWGVLTLQPWSHNTAFGSSRGSGCSHLLAPYSSAPCRAWAPRFKAVNCGELRAVDSAFKNASSVF